MATKQQQLEAPSIPSLGYPPEVYERRNFNENNGALNIFFRKADKIKEEYWIDNGVESVKIKDFVDAENLKKFVQQSNTNDYFIIGREIDLLDEKLSTKNISKTVITEFKKLYPLYELMKAKL